MSRKSKEIFKKLDLSSNLISANIIKYGYPHSISK